LVLGWLHLLSTLASLGLLSLAHLFSLVRCCPCWRSGTGTGTAHSMYVVGVGQSLDSARRLEDHSGPATIFSMQSWYISRKWLATEPDRGVVCQFLRTWWSFCSLVGSCRWWCCPHMFHLPHTVTLPGGGEGGGVG
jgi:hypothetical protein